MRRFSSFLAYASKAERTAVTSPISQAFYVLTVHYTLESKHAFSAQFVHGLIVHHVTEKNKICVSDRVSLIDVIHKVNEMFDCPPPPPRLLLKAGPS